MQARCIRLDRPTGRTSFLGSENGAEKWMYLRRIRYLLSPYLTIVRAIAEGLQCMIELCNCITNRARLVVLE